MAAIPANLPVRVWVCPVAYLDANGQQIDPNGGQTAEAYGITVAAAGAWVLYPGLIPVQHTTLPSSVGSAEFQLLRTARTEVGDNQPYAYPGLVEGMYVVVDAATDGPMSFDDTLWDGYITHIDATNLSGDANDRIGTVAASELGDLLDRQQVRGWKRLANGTAQELRTAPSANIGDPSGQIIGNCIMGPGHWVFASTPTDFGYAYPDSSGSGTYTGDIGKYWTRWRLLDHAIAYCRTKAMPIITIVCQDGSQAAGLDPTDQTTIAGYLNQTTLPEVFSTLDVLTWRGFLDLMIPRDRNLGWVLSPVDSASGVVWELYIYSSADDDSYGMPANDNQVEVDATVDPLVTVKEIRDVSDLPDKIVIEGSNCIFNGTLSMFAANLAIGWNQALQSAFFAAASGLTGYGSLSPVLQRDQNRMYREQGWLKDVGARFVINPAGDSDVRIELSPHVGGQANPLCPLLSWDTQAKTLTITASSAPPYIGASVIQRTLSVPFGYKSDGTDQRTQWQKIQPQYMPLKAFLYDTTGNTGYQWRDLGVPSPLTGNARASISPDDRGAAMRVEFTPRELFLKGIWPTDGSAALADVDPSVVGFDPTTLVVTLAIESDQKVRVEMNRPGLGATDQYINRPLIIRLPQLQCMGIHKGTVIGIPGTAGVDTADTWSAIHSPFPGGAGGIFWLRNDWALADRYLSQAANFAFRPRRSVVIERLVPTDKPEWAKRGALITGIKESDTVTTTVSTVVERVTRVYGRSPRLIVQTSLPHAPAFMGNAIGGGAPRAHPSPSHGGPISNALGATQAQAIHHLRHRVDHLHQHTRSLPLVTQLPYNAPSYTVQVINGQLISGVVPVIEYAADPLTVPTAYDPTTATSYVAGIGNGYLYSAGQLIGKVLVRHNFAGMTDPLMSGDVYAVGTPVSVPVTGGGTVTAYPIIGTGA